MGYTKTTAVLLAISMFLAGCGGSTGSAASGAGVTASGQEQASGQQDAGQQASGQQASGQQDAGQQDAGQQASGQQDTGQQAETASPYRDRNPDTKTPISEENYSDPGRSKISMNWRPRWPRIPSALCIPATISPTFTTTSRGSPRQTSSLPNLTSEFEAPSHLSRARRPGVAAGALEQWPPARPAF